MPSEPLQVRVEFTPEFKRNLRALSKKYRHIRSDVQPVIEQPQAGNGAAVEPPGGSGSSPSPKVPMTGSANFTSRPLSPVGWSRWLGSSTDLKPT